MKQGYEDFFRSAKKASKKNNIVGSRQTKGRYKVSDSHEEALDKIFNSAESNPMKKRPQKSSSRANDSLKSTKRSVIGPKAISSMLLGALLALYGVFFPDHTVALLSSLTFSVGTPSYAKGQKDQEKKSDAKGEEKAGATETGSKSKESNNAKKNKAVSEDNSYFTKLSARSQELDRREADLAELEEELHKQKEEIEVRIKKLEQIRNKISGVLKDRVKIDKEKVEKLVQFYSSMKPKQAAEIVSNLNEDLAVEVLGQMKKKNAASILNLLEPAKARVLSEKFAGYQKR